MFTSAKWKMKIRKYFSEKAELEIDLRGHIFITNMLGLGPREAIQSTISL